MYSKRVVALLIIFSAGLFGLGFLRDSMGKNVYFLGLIALVVVVGALVVRQSLQNMPEGTGVTSEKSIHVHATPSQLCEVIPRLVEKCGWRLMEVDSERGYFKSRIGRNFWTLYGQIFRINVSKMNEDSSKLDISCEAYRQIVDYGRNDKMIANFQRELSNLLSLDKS